ncbi:HYR-like domain-containing protein, partial [Aquimarina pacifica]|uniref:HYR-like domain-containing protein n=1 Tax=Aquimarina pacifica TaxID=1296415 RepID=UPI00054CE132
DTTTSPDVPTDAGSTVECLSDAVQPTAPVVLDACDVAITPVITENTDPVCEGSKIYTFTYTDCAGNVSAYVYTYTIDTTTSPDVPVDAGSTVECLSDAVQPIAPVVLDACDVAITPVITENTDPVCEGSKIYTFTYTDCAGNVSEYVYTYTIDLTTTPDVPMDAGSTVACLVDAVQPISPVVLDACDVAITPVITENTDPVCEGSKIYTFTYTDCAGNASAYVYTYTIDTTTSPDVPVDAGSTVECLSDAVQPAAPVVLDACDVAITPVITENTDPVCEGSKIYTFTYTDCAGNVSTYVYTYTIDTTTSPDVPVDAGSTVECLSDAVQPIAPVVLDACDVAITPVITENTDPVCEGSKIYTFTYTDCAGNVSEYVYTYTIDLTTTPDVPMDAGSTVACLVDAVQPISPVVLDACDVAITPVITENTDPVCEGSKIYTFTYTDCAGNASAYIYTYTIDLTTPPDVPLDAGSTVECLVDAVQPAAPVVLDACDVAITPVITENTDPVCEGSKIYTFTYTDCAGNASAYVYTYTIDTTTSPDVPADAGSIVNSITDAVQPSAPVVVDACNVAITPVITENTDPLCDGDKIYTFTYTDCAGNSAVYTYTYTIDVTATLEIMDTSVTSCSNVSLGFDLSSLIGLSDVTFTWVATPNANVTGNVDGTGTLIPDTIRNLSLLDEDVIYIVTPFNSDGCQGNDFALTVTVYPEPEVETVPTENTCSDISLNHDLLSDVDLTGTTFIWQAIDNINVSGETTSISTATTISDLLVNTSGVEQIVTYQITPRSTNGCDGEVYEYIVTVSPRAELRVTKSDLPAEDGSYDTVGEVVIYEIIVENISGVEISDITVLDSNSDSGSASPVVEITTIPGFGRAIFRAEHTLTQEDLDTGQIINVATVRASDPCGTIVSVDSDDPDTSVPDDATIVILDQKPVMSFTKLANPAPDGLWDEVGELIVYSMVVTNSGNVTLTDIEVTDPNADAGTINPTTISVLSPGQEVAITAEHLITQSDLDNGVVINSATVTALDPEGNTISDLSDDPSNDENNDVNGNGNPDDVTITVMPQFAILDITKEVDFKTYMDIGDVLNYIIEVTNRGNVTLFDVTVDDPIVTFISPNIIDQLKPGESFMIEAEHTIVQNDITDEMVINTATVVALLPDMSTEVFEDSDDFTDLTNLDVDNDGDFDDPTISYLDSDDDGIINIEDLDDDNDGITDIEEQNDDPFLDTDDDGIIDSLDLDADGDGIYDYIEAGHGGQDIDGDHRVDGLVGADGIPNDVQDADNGTVNYDPLDTDTDGIDDFQEANNASSEDEDGIEIFNIVTPNGDGDHDIFLISNIEAFPNNELSIFNRWGVQVYYAKGYGQNEEYFRGESRGRITINKEEQLPVGTYFYILSYKTEDEVTKNKSGYLYLTR